MPEEAPQTLSADFFDEEAPQALPASFFDAPGPNRQQLGLTPNEHGQDWYDAIGPQNDRRGPVYGPTSAQLQAPLNVPGVPAPPIPYALQNDAQQAAQAPRFINPRTGRSSPRLAPGKESGPAQVLDMPLTGGQQMVEGAEQMAEPGLAEKAGGASKIIRGGMEATAPFLLPIGAATARLKTAVGIGYSMAVQPIIESELKGAGMDPRYAELSGDVGGLIGGTTAAHVVPEPKFMSGPRAARTSTEPPVEPSAEPKVSPEMEGKSVSPEVSPEMPPETLTQQDFDRLEKTKPATPLEQAVPPAPTEPARPGFLQSEEGTSSAAEAVKQLAVQDVIPAAKESAAWMAQAWDGLKKVADPTSRGESAQYTAGSMREHMADRQRAYDRASQMMEPAHRSFDKIAGQAEGGIQPARDVITDFIDQIERGNLGKGQPGPGVSGTPMPSALEEPAGIFRSILDNRRLLVQQVDPTALQNYIENYFPHIWKDPAAAKPIMEQIMMEYFGKRPMEGNKAWQRLRSIPFFSQGIARGLEPVSWNPVDLVTQRIVQMDKFIMAHKVFNDLEGQGLLKYVREGERAPDGYAKIDDDIATVKGPRRGAVGLPDDALNAGVTPEEVEVYGKRTMGRYWAPEPAARVINNHLSPGLRGGEISGQYYRAWTGASNWLNQFQLGFSGFHAGITSLEAVVSKVALGFVQMSRGDIAKGARSIAESPAAFLTQPLGIGDKLVKEWSSPGSQGTAITELVNAMKAGGWRANMDRMYKTQMTDRMIRAWRAGNPLGAAWRAPFAAVEQSVKPVLEWLVPRQKAAVVADLVRYEMERNPNMSHAELRKVAAKAVDSADNRMGQLAYDNLFWDKTLKDIAMASVRSVGWNLGTIRELGGGVLDMRHLVSGPREWTYRTAYIPALVAVTAATGALMQGALARKAPEGIKDLFFPQTGNLDENGNPERVSIPSYMKDIYHYSQDPGRTVVNKLHPMINLVAEMLTNKDYYGTEIRNADDPFMRQLLDDATHIGKGYEPFVSRGFRRQTNLGENPIKAAANFVGITPAPTSINMTPAERKMADITAGRRPQGSRTREKAEESNIVRDSARSLRMGRTEDAVKRAREALLAGKIAPKDLKEIDKKASESPLEHSFKALSPQEATEVMALANDKERKALIDAYLKKLGKLDNEPSAIQEKVTSRIKELGLLPLLQQAAKK